VMKEFETNPYRQAIFQLDRVVSQL